MQSPAAGGGAQAEGVHRPRENINRIIRLVLAGIVILERVICLNGGSKVRIVDFVLAGNMRSVLHAAVCLEHSSIGDNNG